MKQHPFTTNFSHNLEIEGWVWYSLQIWSKDLTDIKPVTGRCHDFDNLLSKVRSLHVVAWNYRRLPKSLTILCRIYGHTFYLRILIDEDRIPYDSGLFSPKWGKSWISCYFAKNGLFPTENFSFDSCCL